MEQAERAAANVFACIPGWRDLELLDGCLSSLEGVTSAAVYLEGPYRTFTSRTDSAPADELDRVIAGRAVTRSPHVFETEAEKRSALADFALSLGGPDGRPGPWAGWLLFLDTDERLESPPGALAAWCAALPPTALWAEVNLYQPGMEPGYGVPRLIRARPGLEFRPPRDFDVYLDGRRIAWHGGEGPAETDERAYVPRDVLRIRHDRQLRTPERAAMTARYVNDRGERERRRRRAERQQSISG